jgi:hypothetical protein
MAFSPVIRSAGRLCTRGEHADFGDAGAEFILQILSDARPLLFHGSLMFDLLALAHLCRKLRAALLDLPVKLGYPLSGRGQHARERAYGKEQSLECPPGRARQDFDCPN